MITGTIKSQVDQVWNAFWSGGISNPLEVIEQITYLLFIRRLDDIQTLRLNQRARTKKPVIETSPRASPQTAVGHGLRLGRIARLPHDFS